MAEGVFADIATTPALEKGSIKVKTRSSLLERPMDKLILLEGAELDEKEENNNFKDNS
eukprot:gene10620-11744_t